MSSSFEQAALWRRTLALQKKDEQGGAREKLRVALLRMRDKAVQLVQLIPPDCHGLTVHDVTHLDALWEMADLITGTDFELNPVEAFVFGASVLLHDSGMSVASYPGGMADITKTTEWTDTAHAVYRRNGITNPSQDQIFQPSSELKDEILFSVLRRLHAKHAEELVSVTWPLPNDPSDHIRLIEDTNLRNAYGQSIGRIAHSHHWSLERVTSELRDRIGAAGDLPGEWTLHEIKVACLLRCADIAHIDHRS
jgi:hypothetical protein